MRLMNDTDIVAKELKKNLVLHGNIGLTPYCITELGFDHAESGFGITPGVVVLQEIIAPEVVSTWAREILLDNAE